ncbi:hypothetical protein Taro_008304 [Colocasia esculenta]|uniref:RNase H type-1 domain-containing protein n=1 Tax=Colocasia esculenta TaxID=4460 RepID=A0A843TTE6_COLES|nr:hypothetical protein [Colocasia esculenta]
MTGPLVYLGVPLHSGKVLTSDYKMLIDRINSTLSGWKAKLISQAGRIILINSVLASLPIYLAVASYLPKGIINYVEKCSAAFFWNGNDGSRRRHWVAWNKMQCPKVEGGLGIRNINHVQTSLAVKQISTILHGTSLWASYARKRFAGFSPLLIPGISNHLMLHAIVLVKANSRWIPGKGDKVDFIHDYWYGDQSIAETVLGPPPAGITLQAVVKDPYHPARSLVPPQVFLDLSLTQDEDKCIWKPSSSGEFTTKSTYDLTETAWSASQVLLSYGFTYQTLANQTKLVRWIPPVVDFCLNVDGASKGNPGLCGGGGCIRDKHDNVLLAFSNYYGVGNSLIAEARALCDGLRLAHFVGVRLSAIYSDSSTLVHSMQQGKCPSWLIHRWWRSSRNLLGNVSSFVHVFQETNQVADRLANHAIYFMCNEVIMKFKKKNKSRMGMRLSEERSSHRVSKILGIVIMPKLELLCKDTYIPFNRP